MGNDFVVYSEGLFYASVCSSLPTEEVEKRMKERLCGTHNGWSRSEDKFADGHDNPCPCNHQPETHKHYLFVC